jgi:hypothetical protein
VLAFAMPEYILYWGSILYIAMLIKNSQRWCKNYRLSKARKKAG